MKKLFLALAAIMFCTGAFAQQQYQERDYVELNVRASREVTPDEIFLQIILDQNETKGKYTIDQLEIKLTQALKRAGVDAEKELKISDMSSDLKSFLLKRNEGRITKEFVLKVDNAHLMPVFRELEKEGITNVNVQSSRYSKSKEVYEQLLGEAVVIAKKRAEVMAKAANQSVGRVIYIQSYDNSGAYDATPEMAGSIKFKMMGRSNEGYEAPPVFEFNKTKIEAVVTVRLAL